MAEVTQGKRPISAVLPVVLVFSWLVIIAFFGTPFWETPFETIVLSAAYLLFACTSVWSIAWLTTIHRLLGASAAIAVSPLFVWHFREVFRLPDLKSQVPFACVGAATILFFLCRNLPRRRLLARFVTAALMFIGIVALSYTFSPSLRWQLVNQHTLFGFPAWSILGSPVEAIEGNLWNEHERATPQVRRPSVEGNPSPDQPTIIFILLDTLRRDTLSAYGGDPNLMPQLNEIARESIVFENVLANASWTRPSIGSMFTGLHQEYHGAVGRENALSQSSETLAEILSDQGYETAAFVTNWGAVGKDAGFDQGFSTFRECRSPEHPYVRADALTQEVKTWVTERTQDQARLQRPLFLYIHYLDPHTPYLSGGWNSNVFSKARSAYENEVRFLDEHVSKLIRSLEDTIEEPLFTIVVSDHGEEFGDHGKKGHGFTVYQEVVRIPAFIRTPKNSAASVSARLEGRDIFDLVLQSAADPKFEPSSWAESKDRTLRYTSQYLRTDVPIYRPEYRHSCIQAVERDGLFLIHSALGPTLELYDRTADPMETRNLIRSHWAQVPSLNRDLERLTEAPWIDRESAQLTGDSMEQLRALGYIN